MSRTVILNRLLGTGETPFNPSTYKLINCSTHQLINQLTHQLISLQIKIHHPVNTKLISKHAKIGIPESIAHWH